MLKTIIGFNTSLTTKLDREDTTLPLPKDANDFLLNKLSTGDYTYLVIKTSLGGEVVKVTNQCGYLTVDRAQDYTSALVFPRGSCVTFEVTPQVVKDLICTYDCCAGDCPQNLVSYVGGVVPLGKQGSDWEASFIFTGDTPMHFSAVVPEWVSVTYGANYVTLKSKLPAVGSFPLAISATNCSGKGLATGTGTLVVTS